MSAIESDFLKNLSFPYFRGFSGFCRLWQKSAFRKFLVFFVPLRLALPVIRAFSVRSRMPYKPLKSPSLYDSSFVVGVKNCHWCQFLSLSGFARYQAFSGFLLKSGVKKRHFAEMAKIVFARYQGVFGFLGGWHGVCIYIGDVSIIV